MKCPLCDIEMAIKRSRYTVSGDESPDTETKLFNEQVLSCRNKKCPNFQKDVSVIKNPLQLSKD